MSEKLIAAAQRGDIKAIERELAAGADINFNEGNTALHLAARGGQTETVTLLLDRGAAIDAATQYRNTALILAAWHGHPETVALLLEGGAAIDARNHYDKTALQLAAVEGHTEVIALLLERGAAIDAADQYRNTALHLAARGGHTEVIALLLERGAAIDAADQYRNTALHLAARGGQTETVTLLLDRGAAIDAANQYHNTALILAAWHGHPETVALLLDRGAAIDAADQNDNTALHRAAHAGHTGTVELLLDRGATIDARNQGGKTALREAADSGRTDTVALLEAAGNKGWGFFSRGAPPALAGQIATLRKRIDLLGADLVLYALVSADTECFEAFLSEWHKPTPEGVVCEQDVLDVNVVLSAYLEAAQGNRSISQAIGKAANALRQPQPSFALHLMNIGGGHMKLTMSGPSRMSDAAFVAPGVTACDVLYEVEPEWYNRYRNDVLCLALKAAGLIDSDDESFRLLLPQNQHSYALLYTPRPGQEEAAGGVAAATGAVPEKGAAGGVAAATGAVPGEGAAATTTTTGARCYELHCAMDSDRQCKFTLKLDPRLAAQQKLTTKKGGIFKQAHGFFSSSKGGDGPSTGGGSAASATDGVSQSEAVLAAGHQGQAPAQERPDADNDAQALLLDSEPKDTKCNIC